MYNWLVVICILVIRKSYNVEAFQRPNIPRNRPDLAGELISERLPSTALLAMTGSEVDWLGNAIIATASPQTLFLPNVMDLMPAIMIAKESYETSLEPIHTAFSVATFFPQPFWLLMILFPNSSITKKIMGGLELPLLCSLVHFFIVVSSIAQQGSGVTAPLSEFNDVFNPAGDPQMAFMGMVSKYPNFVAEEWSHVLTWDLFVGRWIWLDGIRRGIFTAPAVLFANLIGPPGLLIHWITCTLSGKEIFESSEKNEIENLW